MAGKPAQAGQTIFSESSFHQMEEFLLAERRQLRIICESLESKARGFELQAKQHVSSEGQKMAVSAQSQLEWAAAYRRAAAIIRNQIASEGAG